MRARTLQCVVAFVLFWIVILLAILALLEHEDSSSSGIDEILELLLNNVVKKSITEPTSEQRVEFPVDAYSKVRDSNSPNFRFCSSMA
jgi:hypothetical protein